IGAIGSGEVWRGYNNTTPADGATITSLLLSTSNVAESYEEANPSVADPNSIPAGQRGEWDWVLQENGAAYSTPYYFRMVKGDGTALDTYTRYSQLTTAAPMTLTQDTYRWYLNANALNPTKALEAENTAYSDAAQPQVFRVRMNMAVAGSTLSAGSQAFKLQYSTSTGGPWTDVDAIGGAGIWRGYNNATPADGAAITSLLLSTSNVMETYEEANPSPNNPNALSPGQRGEWDWVLQHNGASPSVTYYFRMVKSSGTALDTYTRYPTLTTTYPTIAWDAWESANLSGGSGWVAAWTASGDYAVTTAGTAYQGRYHLRLRRATGYAKRQVNLSGKTTALLQFWAMALSFEGSENAQLLVSSNGTTWTTVKTWVNGDDDNLYHFNDIDLSPFV
ncbi:MAG: hypothetical protein AAB270_09240, partial [Chloroflexota bacterium]